MHADKIFDEEITSLSLVDPLTGLSNHRAMTRDLEKSHNLAIRYKRPYSVALFDVDHFSNYNDCYGHRGGDLVLQRICDYLHQSIRTCDRLYRYGGEELLMVMPETDLYGALVMADRILSGLVVLSIPHKKCSYGVVTMSCGVASQVETNGYASWEELVDLADRGLYVSKNSGRNRATIIPPEDARDDSVPRMHGINS
jgi:diguanylate cyclase (GGDEF)-like protein